MCLSLSVSISSFSQVGARDSKKKLKDHYIVRIQPTMVKEKQTIDESAPIFVMNEDKTIYGELKLRDNPCMHPELIKIIKEKGWKGLLGFFNVICSPDENNNGTKGRGSSKQEQGKNMTILINSKQILPIRAW